MKSHLLSLYLVAGASVFGAEAQPLYLDSRQPIEARVEDLLSRLTLEEKVSMVHAKSTFATEGVPRLGIPELWMDDGPMGVREEVGEGFRNLNREDDFATAMPATIGLAATFNTDLATAYGTVIGQEAKQRNKNIMLGPSLNIQRTPLCGRNFEYLGEDPFLTARIAVNYIKGEQAQGVAACAKHFAANNQEVQRGSINAEMEERVGERRFSARMSLGSIVPPPGPLPLVPRGERESKLQVQEQCQDAPFCVCVPTFHLTGISNPACIVASPPGIL